MRFTKPDAFEGIAQKSVLPATYCRMFNSIPAFGVNGPNKTLWDGFPERRWAHSSFIEEYKIVLTPLTCFAKL